MKKVKIFALMLFAGAAIFTSCKKDETLPAATIEVTNNKTAYTIYTLAAADTTILFNVTIAAEAKIEAYTMKKTVGSTTVTYPASGDAGVAATGFAGETAFTYHFSETFSNTETYPITYKFSVTDKDGNSADVSVVVSKNTAAVTTPLAYENTAGVVWNLIGANQGAWDLATNAGVSSGGTETSKDMKNTSTVALGWVNAWTVGTGNTTLYVKAAAGYDYANATVESATAAYAAGTGAATVTGPAANDIFIAKLRGGTNYSVIKITSVVETPSDDLDKIAFSYKKLLVTSGQ